MTTKTEAGSGLGGSRKCDLRTAVLTHFECGGRVEQREGNVEVVDSSSYSFGISPRGSARVRVEGRLCWDSS